MSPSSRTDRHRSARGVRSIPKLLALGPDDEEDDLVWVDGYFVRWPGPATE